ncbi:MAG: tetratricopeptide repeat protein [Candidatus Thorarchaeota archaeon]
MNISMHKELERGWNLYIEGKIEEALQVLTDFEKLEEITLEDKHNYRLFKCNIFSSMGKFQESLQIAEQDYQESKSQNKLLFLIDSIFEKWFTLFMLGGEAWMALSGEIREDVVLSGKLLKSFTQEPPIEVRLRKGLLFFMKGYYFYWEGKLDKAIEYHKRSLAILENYDITATMIPFNLHILGVSYADIGELDLALDSHKKSLDLYKGSMIYTNSAKGVTYNSIGNIYFQKGALDQAIRYFEKSLKIMEQNTDHNSIWWSGNSYDCLIKVFLYKDSPKEAQNYIDHFYQYLEKNQKFLKLYFKISPMEGFWYRISKARILSSSSRVRDRAKAEKILKKILEESQNRWISMDALMVLCEFYFQELKVSNDLEILEDIQPLIDKLSKAAEQSNSFSLRAYAFLLNGNISLLQLNMGDARRYLTEAQQIADSHSLQRLAREISHAHDQLIEQLDGLESYKKKKMTLSERMNLAALDDTLDLMQGRRAVNAPNLIDEEPVLLLIITGGGILLFSYPFSDEIKINDELFGSFLSAITSFSDEFFSEGLDRAKFGQYTILMKEITDFSFCYVFKGQTYLAQKKFTDFIEDFQASDSMMQTLEKFNQTSQVIELKDFPFFEGFIKRIFMNR